MSNFRFNIFIANKMMIKQNKVIFSHAYQIWWSVTMVTRTKPMS